MRPSGFTRRPTKCTSHRVAATTAAKPIDEQIDVMSDPFVMLAMKALSATLGAPERIAITRPAVKRMRRVSQRFKSAAIVRTTTIAAIQMVQLIIDTSP